MFSCKAKKNLSLYAFPTYFFSLRLIAWFVYWSILYIFLIFFYMLHYFCSMPTNIIFKYPTIRYPVHLIWKYMPLSTPSSCPDPLGTGIILSLTLHPVWRQIYYLYLQNVSRIWSPISTSSAAQATIISHLDDWNCFINSSTYAPLACTPHCLI